MIVSSTRFVVSDSGSTQAKQCKNFVDFEPFGDDYGNVLIDTATNTIVFSDVGMHYAPEDCTLDRSLEPLVELLNQLGNK